MTNPKQTGRRAEYSYSIPWRLCRNGLPPVDDDVAYLVTICTNHKPHVVSVQYGKYAPPVPSDDRPAPTWLVLINGEQDQAEWEPPLFYNCQVIAWAEMPMPFAGKEVRRARKAGR